MLPSPDLCNEYSSRQNNGTAECAWNPEETFQEWDMGFDFYAPQSFEDEEGRRILIGWAGVPDTEKAHRNLSVENGWQHCLTLPTELVYHSGKIFRRPVRELEELPWKEMYPDASILPLDYDPDVSFANIENRLQMLIMSFKNKQEDS